MTTPTKFSKQVLVCDYTTSDVFRIPAGITLSPTGNNYGVKWGTLYVEGPDGEEIELAPTWSAAEDTDAFKRPATMRIESASDYGFSDDEESEDEVDQGAALVAMKKEVAELKEKVAELETEKKDVEAIEFECAPASFFDWVNSLTHRELMEALWNRCDAKLRKELIEEDNDRESESDEESEEEEEAAVVVPVVKEDEEGRLVAETLEKADALLKANPKRVVVVHNHFSSPRPPFDRDAWVKEAAALGLDGEGLLAVCEALGLDPHGTDPADVPWLKLEARVLLDATLTEEEEYAADPSIAHLRKLAYRYGHPVPTTEPKEWGR